MSILTCFITMLLGYFFYLQIDFRSIGSSVIANQLFLSNIYFLENSDYFAEGADILPLIHTWSLAVEEQFYFLYPIMILFVRRITKVSLFQILCIFCGVSFMVTLL